METTPDQASPFAGRRLSLAQLRHAYRRGVLTPSACVEEILRRLDASGDNPVWISRVSADTLRQRAAELDAQLLAQGPAILDAQPLFGVPYAVKDNIDVAGMPTTSACPAFADTPRQHATAVARIEAAGGVLVGKTNLDQFATGLVGTRSPYGIVRHPDFPDYIAGGSSSGSAVAVAQGLVPFALGTDTAGSGRVPAGYNALVGLKPSRGLVSTAGVAPACRSLDCVSVFATDVADAWQVLQVLAAEDARDAYSRTLTPLPVCSQEVVIAIPLHCQFMGDAAAQAAFEAAVETLRRLPFVHLVTVDTREIFAAAALLYDGPWVAERRAALGDFFDTHAADMDPSVRTIIGAAERFDGVSAFEGQYRLAGHQAAARRLFENVHALMVPTTPKHPTIAEVLRDPIVVNSQLGLYTNFANLLDFAAIAIPAAPRHDGLPFGITLLAPAGADHRLASLAEVLVPAFAGADVQAPYAAVAFEPLPYTAATVEVAVIGAHLSGEPLNRQLLECGARLKAACRTVPRYRLYALANSQPAKPGIARVQADGVAIDVEVWQLPLSEFGRLVSWVSAPLAIGSVELEDGRWVKSFVCEPWGIADAEDISRHGGWRAYCRSLAQPPSL